VNVLWKLEEGQAAVFDLLLAKMSAPESAAQPGAGWDEAQCMAALAQLEQLQAQVRTYTQSSKPVLTAQIDDLRLAIPRIIEPFHRPPNPSTFKLYSQGVVGSQNGIRALNEAWRAPEIQEMFAHTKKSYDANQDLAACASIPSHGWVERERRERESHKRHGENTAVEDHGNELDDETISRIIAEVQSAQPNIKLQAHNDSRCITVRLLTDSLSADTDSSSRYSLSRAP
jgi:hypothetical protein